MSQIAEKLKSKNPRISKLEYFFSKKVGEALAAYNMIDDKDKILVGISGGKDSMSLLKVLRYKQKRLPINYELKACYVDMGMDDKRRKTLEAYLKDAGYDYMIEETKSWESRKKKPGGSNCFWCSFNRRRALFQAADRLGCNKIALGHHMDDMAETFLLNLFFHGEISTMLPKQALFEGKFYIVRPLALCEEKFTARYARASGFPEFKDKCPESDMTKRMLMKNILGDISKFNRDVKKNIFRSMKRIKKDYILN